MSGGAGFVGGWQAPEGVVGPGEGTLIAHRHHPVRHTLALTVREDFVIDIRDVADIRDVVTARHEPAPHNVEGHPTTDMTHVWGSLNCGTAHIHAHPTVLNRYEFTNTARGGVVKT